MRILFLCSGNYYRSRFSEALFNFHAEKRGLKARAFSRGLATHLVAEFPDLLSPHTVEALAARCIPELYTGPRPVQVSNTDLATSTRIIALKEAEHRAMLTELHPGWENRVEYWHVHDIDFAHPSAALPEIEGLIAALLDEVDAREKSGKSGRHNQF